MGLEEVPHDNFEEEFNDSNEDSENVQEEEIEEGKPKN